MTTTASWYHCSVKPIKRAEQRSVVAAAAYRLGEKLHDDKTDLTHDYSKRKGIEATFTLAPDSAPNWVQNPEKLWNAADESEKRINSQLAREIELALPASVSSEQREAIARQLAAHLVERYHVAVSVALHEPSNHGDNRNHHAHILMTTRRINADGFGEKTRELVDKKQGSAEIHHIREHAAMLINAALADSGSNEQIDHRSFKDRGIDQLPTEHLGVAASQMEKRGESTERGERNRVIENWNRETAELEKQRVELDAAIAAIRQEIAERDAAKETPKPREEWGLTEAKRETFTPSDKMAEEREAQEQTPEAATSPETEPTAAPSTKWQDRIKAERQGKRGDITPPPALVRTDAPRPVKSAFADATNQAHTAHIKQQGEVKHKGLAVSWAEHAVEIAKELAKDIWQDLVSLIKDESNDPDRMR